MARSTKYTAQVKNSLAYVNKKIRDIENLFGIGSEQYDRYVNAVTAALPSGAYTLSESGKLRVKTGRATAESVKKGEVKPLVNLPTARQSMKSAKMSIAKNQLKREGIEKPTKKEISEEAVSISDQEALQELAAKAFIQAMEDSKGKLKYDESVRAEMKEKGAKSYDELRKIIERGQANEAQRIQEQQEQAEREANEQARRERRAEYQREYRARNREEVNRKQREYRARRKAEGR